MKHGFVIDLDRCIGCKGCQVACKQENGVALGANRTLVRTVGPMGSYPDVQMYFLPTPCQQCADPPCVQVCPTGACWQNRAEGVVLIDREQCIGCRSCGEACPYQANTFNQELRVMDKCDTCIAARAQGELPACVRNCAGGALRFGDLDDPESEVSRLLASVPAEKVHSLRDFGNGPSIRYILRRDKWVDALPQELETAKGGRNG